ncbi:hypothetical protein A2567_02475 [Candidatus Azambacteria bacterium RIFOXYD1_FULL_42_11]|uniref:Uncharacterized protein n=4 Tax=Candidatus Azamiibacteriota TaxID=1752741 RepID=A0A0G1BH24_9BACT|nr:MAG: hypothetical protein UV07_C0015G0008 [Candidatus Azambacteria bacterium GW2011_GWB1_42_17]KKS45586.1 MAG: hypothetical protein UV10_C0019G0006 [Candidatus Azambacteria bacterium GW2011_GWA1_42_19]KKS75051.1 MAG: hypothetical protein UV48_C0020G0006 [Candidatus Azambacteria bacterium GW2011_GWA2_42_9]KKS88454.1 MAG: hypothetical protein UV62_C0007G0017 [Parcubacteria group bacterium GW2011_GWC1_43_11]OGD42054.1 MAG: hypothetical protein A2567_02475 [Candidatus Azambacteria bacterium RIFO
MKKDFIKKIGVGIGAGFALLPLIVLAIGIPGEVPGPIITSPADITRLVSTILNWTGGVIMTVALIMLLWSAILYLAGGASEAAQKKAKSMLLYSIIGIVVAILAFSVQPFLDTLLRGRFS